jgi:hypothetical protein
MSAAPAADIEAPADGEPVPGWAVRLLIDVAVIKTGMSLVTDHESRLRALERRAYMLAGVAVLGGAGAGQLLDLLKT